MHIAEEKLDFGSLKNVLVRRYLECESGTF